MGDMNSINAMLVIRNAVPPLMQAEIRTAYQHDPDNWWRRPSFRLWLMAVKRVLLSHGIDAGDQLIPLVKQAMKIV
jgi:hypothetical protein